MQICNDFGEEAMRRWWRDKDYMEIIPETILSRELELEDTINYIYGNVLIK